MEVAEYGEYGDVESLRFGRRDKPGPPGRGQVVVRVLCAALNPIDWKLRAGQLRLVYPLAFPVTPGFDFCGIVEKLGPGAEEFSVGDRVCGMSDQRAGGAVGECAVCSASVIAPAPSAMSDEMAAALPLAGLTALQGLREHGRMERGMRVLVNGASGGVGHLAVQVARFLGGEVTAVCGPDNLAWVGELGPASVVNYRQPGWLERLGTFDLIFDAVGNLVFWKCRRHLRRGGSFVSTLPGPAMFFNRWIHAPVFRRRARAFLVKPDGVGLKELLDAWSSGRLRVRVDQVYDWKDFREAFRHLESGHARGKVVVRIGRHNEPPAPRPTLLGPPAGV